MIMLQNVGVNTSNSKKSAEIPSTRTTSVKLKERNVKHTKISNIKELNQMYNYGEMLGKGVFGTVVKITDRATKKIWALKIVDKKNLKGSKLSTIENEIKILRMVNHPHIIYLEQVFESTKSIYLVMQLCNAELAQLLRVKKVFSESETKKVMENLSSAIAYLHKYEIVHRDLKLENILTADNPQDPTDELFIKVTDFGLSIVKSCTKHDQMLKERCGTLAYMAPEIISRSNYSQQCDVWAMGVICFLLLTGSYPFFSKNENELADMICNREPSYPRIPGGSEAIHLLMKMLEKNPAQRISAVEVGRHAWIIGQTLGADSTHNVLDMMQLWRSEMMVPTNQESDWAEAFSTLERTMTETSRETLQRRKSSILPTVRKDNSNRPRSSMSATKETAVTSKSINRLGNSRNFLPKQTEAATDKPVTERKSNKAATLATATTTPAAATTTTQRALNIKGKSTKLIRIGKVRDDTSTVQLAEKINGE